MAKEGFFSRLMKPQKPTAILGVDFSTEHIRMVHLRKEEGHIALSSVLSLELPEEVSQRVTRQEGIEAIDPTQIAHMIEAALRANDISVKHCCFAIPANFAVARVLSFPKMPGPELTNAVQFEASQFQTQTEGETIIDHFILREVTIEGQQKYEVLVVVLPRRFMMPYVQSLLLAHLQIYFSEISSLSSLRSLNLSIPEADQGGVVVLTIGGTTTDITIVEDGVFRFARSIPLGGNNIREALVSSGVPVDKMSDAQLLSVNADELGEASRRKILPLTIELTDEVIRTLHFSQAHHRSEAVDLAKVILTGSGVWLGNLDSLISDRLEIPTYRPNPFQGLQIKGKDLSPEYLEAISPQFVAAVGLGLRGLA